MPATAATTFKPSGDEPHTGGTGAANARLGLPPSIRACLFDLDGVLTQTVLLHAAAWKETFDCFLRERASRTHDPFVPFEVTDYERYVDGRPRLDGIREFLAVRGIEAADGEVAAIGDRKNERLLELIRLRGVEPYPGSVTYLQAVCRAGLRRAVVSGSANCRTALESAGLADLFEVRIDAPRAAADRLRGKPAPDTFLAAARELAVEPAEAAVFEDALSGLAAGRA